ncbi:MAG: hypothetical protein JWQ98_2361 [Chlorobi bacterium]|jgi:hypothetical protein|nr:hypothetical protein [Chlorobiota bacterium]
MKMSTILKSAFVLAAMVVFACTIGTRSASAQPLCTPTPCPQYWINYNYVYPPATCPIRVNVHWTAGNFDVTSAFADGHYTYPEAASWGTPDGICINNQWIPIPAMGPKYYLTDPCLPPGQCLEIEIRCTPCLEVRIHTAPCQLNPPDFLTPSPFPC